MLTKLSIKSLVSSSCIRLSKTDEVKKNGGYVNIILNCRILSTREKRREWSELYLKDLHHNFPVDD